MKGRFQLLLTLGATRLKKMSASSIKTVLPASMKRNQIGIEIEKEIARNEDPKLYYKGSIQHAMAPGMVSNTRTLSFKEFMSHIYVGLHVLFPT